jgi:hypothetical protein
MTISYNTAMNEDKKRILAIAIIVLIIVGALSTLLLLQTNSQGKSILDEILDNFFKEEDEIEYGDYADIHYIGRFVENDSIFDTSYDDLENRSGGEPLKFFVTLNSSESPSSTYSDYSNSINGEFIKGFIQNLIGLKKGDNVTTNSISPENAYGISPKEGDVINLSDFGGGIVKIVKIKENAKTPPEWVQFGLDPNQTMTIYTLRDESHYIGEAIELNYPSWENSSIVTAINETLIWMKINPPYEIGETFGWIDIKGLEPVTYPENSTSITSINETTIVLNHAPSINDTIQVQEGFSIVSYTVENLTDEKINASMEQSGNKTYKEFNRTTIIERNQTQEIIVDIPDLSLEQIFPYIRELDPDFVLSLSPYADKSVYFEIEVIDIYKAS